jgi:hypothetical protein
MCAHTVSRISGSRPTVGSSRNSGRVLQVHERQRLAGVPRALGARNVVQRREDAQVLVAGQLAVGAQRLRDTTDGRTHVGGLANLVEALDDGAARSGQQRREHLDERAPAGAVAAEQTEHLAGCHLEVQVVDDGKAAEAARQGLWAKCWRGSPLDDRGCGRHAAVVNAIMDATGLPEDRRPQSRQCGASFRGIECTSPSRTAEGGPGFPVMTRRVHTESNA